MRRSTSVFPYAAACFSMDWVSRSIELRERSFTLISISDILEGFLHPLAGADRALFPTLDGSIRLFDGSKHAARVDFEDDGFLVWHLCRSLYANGPRLPEHSQDCRVE